MVTAAGTAGGATASSSGSGASANVTLRGRPTARRGSGFSGARAGSVAVGEAAPEAPTASAPGATSSKERGGDLVQARQCHSESGTRRKPAHFRCATAEHVEQHRRRRPTRRDAQM